jgi:FtsP/CotA-like multicopper oxidase with cupredoxin domain
MDKTKSDGPAPLVTFAFAFGVLGVLALVAAVVVGVTNSDDNGATVAAGGTPTMVELTEFDISPDPINATTGGGLHVMNSGNAQHNLTVEGSDLATATIDAGGAESLDLSSLDPGEYTVFCSIPGHRDAGMQAKLDLTAGAGSASAGADGGATTPTSMTAEQMDQAMTDSITAFPATTEGLGAQVLAPTVLPDGTKQFELTTTVTQWEVAPGQTVEAMTYNGTVPGPTLKVDPGDRVRIILHNELPQSTSIHFHGLLTPNAMDGTTVVTQDPVKTGESFTYEWTVQDTPAVGMYHSHHNAVEQVPDGLAGAFIVGNLPVPSGVTVEQEQVMVLDDSGTIGYAINGKSFPATAPIVAKQGEWIELHYMNEGTQIHPMHLHGIPQLIIAKDGFPLATPQAEDTVTVAPGERYTVLIHATEPGTWVWHCHILPHAENEHGMFGMVTALVVQP